MPPVKVIRDPTALKKELSAVFAEARRGKLDAKTVNALSVLGNVLLGVMAQERQHQDGREASPLLLLAAEFERNRRAAGLADDEVGGLSPEVEERLANQTGQDPTPLQDPEPTGEQEQREPVPRPRLPSRIRRALAA